MADQVAGIRPVQTRTPVVAELSQHPRPLDEHTGRVFRFTKSGRLYSRLDDAFNKAGIVARTGTAFHILRHRWATVGTPLCRGRRGFVS